VLWFVPFSSRKLYTLAEKYHNRAGFEVERAFTKQSQIVGGYLLMRQFVSFTISFVLLTLMLPSQGRAEATHCIQIGGTIAGSIVEPTLVLGTVTGHFLQGVTQATVTGQEESENKVKLDLKHIFVTDSRDTLQTTDKAVWIPIPEAGGVYHMSTQYRITGGTGRFAEAKGSFENHGEVDTNQGLVTLSYGGQICGVAP
jgi:hypothetical protein